MKNIGKRFLSFLLSLIMVLTLVSGTNWGKEEVKAANATLYYGFSKVTGLSNLSVGTTYLFCGDSMLNSNNCYISIPSGSATLKITSNTGISGGSWSNASDAKGVDVVAKGQGFDSCSKGNVKYYNSAFYYACNAGGVTDVGPFYVYTYKSTTNYTVSGSVKAGKSISTTGVTTFSNSDLEVKVSIPGDKTYTINSFTITDGTVNPNNGDSTITVNFNGVSIPITVSAPLSASCFSISNNVKNYNGQVQAPTIAKSNGVGSITKVEYVKNGTSEYLSSAKDGGVYDVYVTVAAGSFFEAATRLKVGTFTINKITVDATVSVLDKEYDGTADATAVTSVEVDTSALNGGTLNITVTDATFDSISEKEGEKGKDVAYDESGNVIEKTVTINDYTASDDNYDINFITDEAKAKIFPKDINSEDVNLEIYDFIYTWDDTIKTPNIVLQDTATGETLLPYASKESHDGYYDYTVTGTQSHKNFGKYTIRVIGHGNYIEKRNQDWYIGPTVAGYTGTYDGKPHSISITNYPQTATVTFSETEEGEYTTVQPKYTDAGTYTVYYKVTDPKSSKVFEGSETVVINTKKIGLAWENLSFTYDKEEHLPIAKATGLASGETVEITVTGAQTEAGTYEAVATTITGDAAKNYVLPEEVTKNFTIEAREITITWEVGCYEYNGKIQGPEAVVFGLIEGDECNITITGRGKDAGSYTAVVSGIDNANYKIPVSNASKTYSISKRQMTEEMVTIDPTYYYYRYGIEHFPAFGIVDMVDGNNIIESSDYFMYGDTSAEDPGVYEIYVCAMDSGNYTGEVVRTWTVEKHVGDIEIVGTIGKEFDGTPFAVTTDDFAVVAETDSEGRVMTAEDYSSNVTIEYKLKDADDETYTTEAPTNAGEYVVRITIEANDNYYETVKTFDFEIEPKEIEVTWGMTDFTYDGETHVPSATIDNLIGTDEVELVISGDESNAGTYTAKITELTGTDANNYSICNDSEKVFTINPKTVEIEWENVDFIYDGQQHVPSAIVKTSDIIGSDIVNVMVEGHQINAGENYTATATGLDNANYVISGSDTTLFTIAPKEMEVSAENVIVDFDSRSHTIEVVVAEPTADYQIKYSTDSAMVKHYNSDECPEFTREGTYSIYYMVEADNYATFYGSAIITIKHGLNTALAEDVEATYDGMAKSISVVPTIKDAVITYSTKENGTYTTYNPAIVKAGTTTVYYKVAYGTYPEFSGSATIKIAKKNLNITIEDSEKTYGETDPELVYEVEGLVEDDELPTEIRRESGEDVGDYVITIGTVTNNNYNVVVEEGKLTINPAQLTVTAVDQAIEYGKTISTSKKMVDVTGLAKGEELSKISLKASTKKITEKGKITPSGAVVENNGKTTTSNYKITYKAGKLVVYDAKDNCYDLNANLIASQKSSTIDVKWGEVKGADGYDLFISYCGKSYAKDSPISTEAGVTAVKIDEIDGKAIDLKKNYKLYVTAFKLSDGKKVKLAKSITIHLVGKNNKKYTNAKSISIERPKLSMKKGQYSTIKAKLKLYDSSKKILTHTSKFRYLSTNTKVAKVSSSGKITAVGKGKCTIYVYACNGCAKTVSVTVK